MVQTQGFLDMFAAKVDEFQLSKLRLNLVEDNVRGRPAIVIRRRDSSNGGVVFLNGAKPSTVADCQELLECMSFKFFNAIAYQGCFASGDYWYADLVNTRFNTTRQVKIEGNANPIYWNHTLNLIQTRSM